MLYITGYLFTLYKVYGDLSIFEEIGEDASAILMIFIGFLLWIPVFIGKAFKQVFINRWH